MSPRRKRQLAIAASSVAAALAIAMLARRTDTPDGPPRHPDGGFHRGECTWYVYQRAQDDGWRVRFDQSFGRHGCAWCDRVTNAQTLSEPAPHSVVVFAAWPSNPYGHVAYVESVGTGGRFTVTHANFGLGELALKREGVPIYRAEFERVRGGIRLVGGRHVFAVRGYLAPAQGAEARVSRQSRLPG